MYISLISNTLQNSTNPCLKFKHCGWCRIHTSGPDDGTDTDGFMRIYIQSGLSRSARSPDYDCHGDYEYDYNINHGSDAVNKRLCICTYSVRERPMSSGYGLRVFYPFLLYADLSLCDNNQLFEFFFLNRDRCACIRCVPHSFKRLAPHALCQRNHLP